MESNQAGESHMTFKDEQLEDGKSSTVVPQPCEVTYSTESVSAGTGEKILNDFSKLSVNSEPGEGSNTVKNVSAAIPSGQTKLHDIFPNYKEGILAMNYHLKAYPTPILLDDVRKKGVYHKVIQKKRFPFMAFLSFGLHNFTSYAAHFCKYEAQNNTEIVSIGSGDGAVDREIIAAYRSHFGEEIKITLVDRSPDYEVHFKLVDDLVEARPEVVGNCVALIIWPEPASVSDGYDIDAVRKLQPRAALVLYDPTNVSGSYEFIRFLRHKTKETGEGDGCDGDEKTVDGLENYVVEKVARLEVYCEAGEEFEMIDKMHTVEPVTRAYCLRIAKLTRMQ